MRNIKNIIVAAALFASAFVAHAENLIPAESKQGSFAIGCQAYTFRFFSAMEAIQKTAEAGGKVIEFYPGQKFSKEEPGLKWDHTATDEMITKMKAKLDEYKIRA